MKNSIGGMVTPFLVRGGVPGPRSSKRQNKLNETKENKRKEHQICRVETVSIATQKTGGNVTPLEPVPHGREKDTVVRADVELGEQRA